MKLEPTIPSKQFFVILNEEMQKNSMSKAIHNSFERFNKLKQEHEKLYEEQCIENALVLLDAFKIKMGIPQNPTTLK